MSRCPVCASARIVVIISPQRRAFCARCGSRWRQEGSEQHAIERVNLVSAEPEIADVAIAEPEPA